MQYQVMPELTVEEYERLKQDIRENGQLIPIETDEFGNILDGNNRYRICKELGLVPQKTVRAGLSEEAKVELAYTLNLSRRQLMPEQKISIARDMKTRHSDWPIVKIAKLVGINQAELSVQLQDLMRLDTKTTGADNKQRPATEQHAEHQRQEIRDAISEHPEKSDRQIAKETGASPTTVGTQRKKIVTVYNPSDRDAEALKDPDIVNRMEQDDKLSVSGAIREQKRDKLVEHLASVAQRETEAPTGLYDCIVIDPPWPMQKIDRDERPNQTEFDYPTMSVEDIARLEVPAADDCHVFLWTTQKFLPDALEILKAWNLKYVCTFVWHKPNGYKPFGLPIYNCEFVLYAHKGNPRFVDEKQFRVCNEWPTSGHSAKPEEFYDLLRRVTAGRRLDMFSRREIEGFDSWGKEASDGR